MCYHAFTEVVLVMYTNKFTLPRTTDCKQLDIASDVVSHTINVFEPTPSQMLYNPNTSYPIWSDANAISYSLLAGLVWWGSMSLGSGAVFGPEIWGQPKDQISAMLKEFPVPTLFIIKKTICEHLIRPCSTWPSNGRMLGQKPLIWPSSHAPNNFKNN